MFEPIVDSSLVGQIGLDAKSASNVLETAQDLGTLNGTQTIHDSVGSTDTIDYYQFSLNTTSDFSLSLNGLSADVDIALIQDINVNGVADSGETLDFSDSWNMAPEMININDLAAGEYLVGVDQYSGNTEYNLNLTTTANVADWTYMVYLDADNNLERYGIEDFLEMAKVGSTDDVNIVVQMDRAAGSELTGSGYSSDYGNWGDTARGLVKAGDVPDLNWGTSIAEVNMGDQSTLTDFIDWGMSNYQAENYATVLWNHGGGWNNIASDDGSGGDHLTAKEVSGALASCTEVDLVGADACLMGMVEFAHQVSSSASVFVGSEELEPGDGWSHDTILGDLAANPNMTAAQLGTTIVNRYAEFYSGEQTLSAIDLSKVNDLSNAVSQLATTLMNDATNYDINQLLTYRNNSAYYGENQNGANSLGHTDYRDLGTILYNIASDTTMTNSIRVAATTAYTAYESAIIQNHSGPGEGATGLSIYFPTYTSPDAGYNGENSTFAASTTWDEFLNWWA